MAKKQARPFSLDVLRDVASAGKRPELASIFNNTLSDPIMLQFVHDRAGGFLAAGQPISLYLDENLLKTNK